MVTPTGRFFPPYHVFSSPCPRWFLKFCVGTYCPGPRETHTGLGVCSEAPMEASPPNVPCPTAPAALFHVPSPPSTGMGLPLLPDSRLRLEDPTLSELV